MTFKDRMAADIRAVFINEDEFGESITVMTIEQQAIEHAAGTPETFAISGVPGDQADSYAQSRVSIDQATTITVAIERADWLAKIAPILDPDDARDPVRGDRLTFAAGTPYAGDWYCTGLAPDVGELLQLSCVRSDQWAIGGENGVELA